VDRPSHESILWTAGHEGGTTSEWNDIAISGSASVSATTEQAHTGRYSAKLDIDTSVGKSGVRPGVIEILPDYVRKEPKNLPDEAFYSAYYFFPEDVTPGDSWWIVMQWKDEEAGVTLHPTWMVNAWDWENGGEMRFTLRRGVGSDNQPIMPHVVEASAPMVIPLGRWVHLECYYEWSIEPEGRVACWQDGVPIWDLTGVRTDLDMGYRHFPRQWTTTNYSEETTPTRVTIYVDDAAISLTRLGPNWR
jgi:hypothetical protein